MKKTIWLMFIALMLQTSFVQLNFAKTKEEKLAEKVKAGISKLGTGENARIKIKLRDGTKIKGYITEVSEDQFVVIEAKTNQPIVVAYPKVKQVRGNNLSDGAAVLIGVGVAIAAIIILANLLD